MACGCKTLRKGHRDLSLTAFQSLHHPHAQHPFGPFLNPNSSLTTLKRSTLSTPVSGRFTLRHSAGAFLVSPAALGRYPSKKLSTMATAETDCPERPERAAVSLRGNHARAVAEELRRVWGCPTAASNGLFRRHVGPVTGQ